MKHKCDYCETTKNGTRDRLIDIGWSFADIRTPVRKYIKACPEHFNELKVDISTALEGTMAIKWSD